MESNLHIALILDGNRRWAKSRGLPRMLGHRKGIETLRKLLPVFIARGVTEASAYALSTENIAERDATELRNLFKEIEKLAQDLELFHSNQICLKILGSLQQFPASTRKAILKAVKATAKHKALKLNLALGYGGRDEILRAAKKLVKSNKAITLNNFNKALDTAGGRNPDLLIRTGGKQRLSNFLPWQLAYTELYFTEKMWPEFDEKELVKALEWFATQQRNFGK
jgi:undecaprenyl diphosphate synthase